MIEHMGLGYVRVEHVGWMVREKEDCPSIYEIMTGVNGANWGILTEAFSPTPPTIERVLEIIRTMVPDYDHVHLVQYQEDLRTGEYEPIEDLEIDDSQWGDCYR